MDGLPPLIDQHSHGAVHGELGLGSFETHLAAAVGARGPAPVGTTYFDSLTGLAIRRWCPPLLGLEPRCPPARYLARRREVGAYRAGRLLLRGSGIGTFLLEAGAPGELTSACELATAAGTGAHEIVRLEPLAEQVADTSGSVDSFLGYTAEALYAAAQHATAFASGAAHCDGHAPGAGEVRRAADRWLCGRRPGERLGEPTLVRHLLWSAVAAGLPVQLHCRDPRPLAGFLRATAGIGPDLVLLPRAPHHRRAAELAAVHPHVYADAGPCPEETLGRAPFGKLLFSSGARGLPELYVTGAQRFLRAMGRLVREWADEGLCGAEDGRRITEMVGSGTARRVYRLSAEAG
ncbi:amidohydrolase [Streptomyces angustmyceticus]|uniref:Amidohydrolase n=1 Tax=Streptomyces angustmyceticus TaxID=285578 RepID=A0A5J4LMI8_9ACTN|nr:amidohydrolase [Streptomyces angustmyceticus]UAL69800.1 amidohydrolase [Streptomyces angustmyceticus]GES32669.1 amidohydrolase [Streptomyces angustmyceticus]